MNEWNGLRRPTLIECVLIKEQKNGQNCPETLKYYTPSSLKTKMVPQTKMMILPQDQRSSGKITNRLDW